MLNWTLSWYEWWIQIMNFIPSKFATWLTKWQIHVKKKFMWKIWANQPNPILYVSNSFEMTFFIWTYFQLEPNWPNLNPTQLIWFPISLSLYIKVPNPIATPTWKLTITSDKLGLIYYIKRSGGIIYYFIKFRSWFLTTQKYRV